MGTYINIGNNAFRMALNGEYVDKSGLIAVVNSTINTKQRFSCVSRSRRFGKSFAVEMLTAYYDYSCDSRELFAKLEIASQPSFETHLNKYPVIYIDMTGFVTRYDGDTIVGEMQKKILADIADAYPDIALGRGDDLMDYLVKIAKETGRHFILIIDEWDAILREFGNGSVAKEQFVNMLRRMFKDVSSEIFAAVYMTGILPIKKYKTQSALNNFIEYSMVDPGDMAAFFGFTKEEVKFLSEKYNADFNELERWYDGYQIGDAASMFNPNSVIQALQRRRCRNYWGNTGTFETVTDYIKMNFDGLKDDILQMLAGGRVKVNTTKFQNDLSIVQSKDDVLTVLIHLGYLAYDYRKDECYVPNREVAGELLNAVEETGWDNVVTALKKSESLLQATLDGDEEAVAHGVDAVHDENTSILSYNNENSLACVLSIAYYYAKNDYIVHRELPTGKGFADLVFVPRKNVDSPAMVIELKFNKDADAAIDQIKRKQYPDRIAQYFNRTATDNNSQRSTPNPQLLLVGINYDRKTKTHTCVIEKV